MSFQETRTDLSVCNKALSRIFQQPLSGSLLDPANQNKLTARECARWYKSVVRGLLEKHHWGIATKRTSLATITNTRAAEWAAAYAKPSDMAFPVSITPYPAASQVSYYTGVGYLLGIIGGRPVFRYEGSTIYSLVPGASLEYVSYDITEADFTDVFEELVVVFLAAALASPINKDRELAMSLMDEGVTRMNQAIAQNFNVNKPRYDHYISEAELARGSALVDNVLMGWRY